MRPRRRSADYAIGRLCEQRTSWAVEREWACGCAGVAASFRYDERLLRLRAPWLRCCAHIYVVSTAAIGSPLRLLSLVGTLLCAFVSSRLSLVLLLSPPRVTPQAFLAHWRRVALSRTIPVHTLHKITNVSTFSMIFQKNHICLYVLTHFQ